MTATTRKPAAKATAKAKAKPTTPTTFTTVELAAAHSMQPKTLRARIRRNAGLFAQYLVDADTPHVFDAKHRKAIDALLTQ